MMDWQSASAYCGILYVVGSAELIRPPFFPFSFFLFSSFRNRLHVPNSSQLHRQGEKLLVNVVGASLAR